VSLVVRYIVVDPPSVTTSVTAPLWGVGERIFFLHDGRTSNLLEAIEAHANGGADAASEAVQVINNFNALGSADQQDVLNFLRSL
jgi:CxxC motif-containing protein (DUF1111 family)